MLASNGFIERVSSCCSAAVVLIQEVERALEAVYHAWLNFKKVFVKGVVHFIVLIAEGSLDFLIG